MSSDETTSSGVQDLIERLRDEGLAKGQQEAEERVSEARAAANEIIEKAQGEGQEIVAKARKEAEQIRVAGEEAVRLASRDAILQLTEELRADFVQKLHELVGSSMQDTAFLKQLILEIAGKSVPDETSSELKIEFLVVREGGDTTSGHPEDETMNKFIRELSGEALRDGLTFGFSHEETPGVRIQAVNDDLEIELNAETITNLLVKHLSPRFRQIVEKE